MTELGAMSLALVRGGEGVPGMNVERITGPHVSADRALTDYGYCAATVRETCKAAHGGFLWGTYDGAAATCTLTQMPKVCGQPTPDAQ